MVDVKTLFGIRKGLLVAIVAVACCLACAGVAFAWLQGSAQLTQQNAVELSAYAAVDAQAIPATVSVKEHVDGGAPESEELATMTTAAPYYATVAKASFEKDKTYDVAVTFDISAATPVRSAYTGYFTAKIGDSVWCSNDITCTSDSDANKKKTYTFQVKVEEKSASVEQPLMAASMVITPKRGAYLGSEPIIANNGTITVYVESTPE